jgi:hypothetical protein
MMTFKVEGADRMIERIKGFEKDVYRDLQREVREASSDLVKDAQAAAPVEGLSRWGPWRVNAGGAQGFRNTSRDRDFVQASVRSGIRSQFRTRKTGGSLGVYGRVTQNDPAGAIFTLAGSRNRSGHPFNRVVNNRNGFGPWPRLLGPAWTKNVEEARNRIRKAVDSAARRVTRG